MSGNNNIFQAAPQQGYGQVPIQQPAVTPAPVADGPPSAHLPTPAVTLEHRSDALNHFPESWAATTKQSNLPHFVVERPDSESSPSPNSVTQISQKLKGKVISPEVLRDALCKNQVTGTTERHDLLVYAGPFERLQLKIDDRKQIEELIDTAVDVARYLSGQSSHRELLVPGAFVTHKGSPAYCTGHGLCEWLPDRGRFVATEDGLGVLNEEFYVKNVNRVMFYLIHGVAPDNNVRPKDKSLRKCWRDVDRAENLGQAREILVKALLKSPPPKPVVEHIRGKQSTKRLLAVAAAIAFLVLLVGGTWWLVQFESGNGGTDVDQGSRASSSTGHSRQGEAPKKTFTLSENGYALPDHPFYIVPDNDVVQESPKLPRVSLDGPPKSVFQLSEELGQKSAQILQAKTVEMHKAMGFTKVNAQVEFENGHFVFKGSTIAAHHVYNSAKEELDREWELQSSNLIQFSPQESAGLYAGIMEGLKVGGPDVGGYLTRLLEYESVPNPDASLPPAFGLLVFTSDNTGQVVMELDCRKADKQEAKVYDAQTYGISLQFSRGFTSQLKRVVVCQSGKNAREKLEKDIHNLVNEVVGPSHGISVAEYIDSKDDDNLAFLKDPINLVVEVTRAVRKAESLTAADSYSSERIEIKPTQ